MSQDSSATSMHPDYRPCVGVMVLNADDKVWIGRRTGPKTNKDPKGPGLWWQMPQGGIDEGEDPAVAAYRELHEETGLSRNGVELIAETRNWYSYDIPSEIAGTRWKGRFKGQTQKWFAMRFSGSDDEVNITPPPPHQIEFDAWRWASHEELVDLIVPFKRDVYVAVLDEFRHLWKR